MDWLNYHHLLYFYLTAREGTIAASSTMLRLAPSTVSTQIKTLEDALDTPLFERSGRRLVLTAEGRIAYSYAEEIFALGNELLDTFRARPTGRPGLLTVGVADVLWKDIAYQLLQPARGLEPAVRLSCIEGAVDALLGKLAVHQVDVVLADAPLGADVSIGGTSHEIGHCRVALYGRPEIVDTYVDNFPDNLHEAPMLLPTERCALRRHLTKWFDRNDVTPKVVGEFDDAALMTSFGSEGSGLFPAPSLVESELLARRNVKRLAVLDDVEHRFYAITLDRKIRNPAVEAICAGHTS